MGNLHFRLGTHTQAICGERIRDGMATTDDPKKVMAGIHADTNIGMPVSGACADCAATMAVTTLIPATLVPDEPNP